jgi:hypothetical protein
VNFDDVIYLLHDKISKEAKGPFALYLDGKKAGLNELRTISKARINQKLILLKVKIS